MIYKPHDYQAHTTQHIIDHPASGLFLEMGLGKTVSTLTALVHLINERKAKKILIIAPLRVARHTWTTEAKKWDHTKHLTFSKIVGPTRKERKKQIRAKADIYIVNREWVADLVTYWGLSFPYDTVVIDESSSFKNPDAVRFKALKAIRPNIKRVICLTGTPAPKNLLDLWSQIYLLDRGKRLGDTFTKYKNRYFTPNKRLGETVISYKLAKAAHKDDPAYGLIGDDYYEKEIHDLISDICISMKAEDYLKLPPLIVRDVEIPFSEKQRQQYDDFEENLVLELIDEYNAAHQDDDDDYTPFDVDAITAKSAAALSNKLLQFCNGAVYDENRVYHEFHNEKLEQLAEIVEDAHDRGDTVLVFYSYQHDLARICNHPKLKRFKPRTLSKGANAEKDVDDWNAGKIPLLCCHPASAGHGLNLQDGGHICVWFGLNWSLELYLQAVARLHRQGQAHPVIMHRLLVPGTVDYQVAESLVEKGNRQERLLRGTKAQISKVMQRKSFKAKQRTHVPKEYEFDF